MVFFADEDLVDIYGVGLSSSRCLLSSVCRL